MQRSRFLFSRFEQPEVVVRFVVAMLLIHTVLLVYSGYVHSPTANEPAYLVAGLSHWQHGRFELTRVNPPLVRLVAALPVLAAGYEEDWSNYRVGPGKKPAASVGEDFVDANGERSFWLFCLARWAIIPFSWIGAIVCFLWARDLYGQLAGLLACLLWCFSPNIIAHSSLLTADAPSAALGLAACYTFWRWLVNPTWLQAIVTGVVLGLAELAKTTLIVFYPLWPLLWLIYRWSNRHQMRLRDWTREAGMLFVRMVIGIYILNLGYAFDGTCKPLRDYHFVSQLFSGTSSNSEGSSNSDTEVGPPNRFRYSWLGSLPVPFPEQYLLGIDHQQSEFEGNIGKSYLGGTFQDHGWWYYYLYAVAIKVPLGTWILGLLAVMLVAIGRKTKPFWRDELILLAPALIIFSVVSSKTGFNHHMRYVLPAFPYLYVWISQTGAFLGSAENQRPALAKLVVLLAIVWSTTSSLLIYPHSLSYFNELVGGPGGGKNHLLHSNLDWGQDLRYLWWWMEANPEKRPLYLSYYGTFKPSAVGLADTKPFPPAKDHHDSQDTQQSEFQLEPGWYAISVNLLRGLPVGSRDGMTHFSAPLSEEVLAQLLNLQPAYRCGWSIYLYRVPE